MSDDLLRIARQMLAELEASEAYLRSIAIEALPYPKVMAVERRAGRRCAELLAALGGTTFEFATVDDATDELLTGVVRPREGARVPASLGSQAGRNDAEKRGQGAAPTLQNRGSLGAAESVGAYEPFDDGPEGAADDGNDLHSEEEPPRAASGGDRADADTAEIAAHAEPVMASPGFVTFDDVFSKLSRVSADDDEPTISAKRVDIGRGDKRSSDDLFDNLVTFDDPVSVTPVAVGRTHGPPSRDDASLVVTDAGTVERSRSSDRLASALSGDGHETFDLIPDLGEDDLAGFEDEEVTFVKSSERAPMEKPAADKKGAVDSSSWDTNRSNARSSSDASDADRDATKGNRGQAAPTAATAFNVARPKTEPTPAARKDVDWAAIAKPGSPAAVAAAPPASRVQAPLPPAKPPAATPPPRPTIAPSKPPVSIPTSASIPAPKGGTPAPVAAARAAPTRPAEPAKAPTPAVSSPVSDRSETLRTKPPLGKVPTPASRTGPAPTVSPQPPPPGRSPTPTAAPGKPAPARASVTVAPPSTKPQPGMLPGKASKATPGPAAAAAASSRVTAGLYGGGSVPTIRDSDEPRPRAAAIQLNASGSGARVLGMEEEEEPIEIGEAEDDDDIDLGGNSGGGFSVKLQRYEDAEPDDDELELAEEDLEVIQPVQVIPAGPTPDEVRGMLQRAVAAAAAGDLQGGADLYSDVIDADPDNVMAHVARGRLFLDLGDYSRAMSDFMVGEDIAPNDPEPQVAIGDLYFARKDYRKAIDYFNAALEVSPNHAMAYCRRGISHYYRKNYKEAVDDLLKAERLDREIPNIQTYVSMARKKVKR